MATFASITSTPVSGNTNAVTNTKSSDVQRQIHVGATATAPGSGNDHVYNLGDSSSSTNCGREALRGFRADSFSLQNNDYRLKQSGPVPSSEDVMSQRGNCTTRGNTTNQIGSFTSIAASDAASAYYRSVGSLAAGDHPISSRTNPVFISSDSSESHLESTKTKENVEGKVTNPSFLTFTDRNRIGELLNNGDATIFGIKLAPESLEDPNSELRRLINNSGAGKLPAGTTTSTPLNLNHTSFEQSIASSVSATIVTNTNARGDIEREIVIRFPLPTIYASELPRRVSDSSVDLPTVGNNERALMPSVNMIPVNNSSLQVSSSSINSKPSLPGFHPAPMSESYQLLPRTITNQSDKPTNYLQTNQISAPNSASDYIHLNSKSAASGNGLKKKRSSSVTPEVTHSTNSDPENVGTWAPTQNPAARFNTLEQDAADVLKLLASSPKNYIGGTAANQSKQTTEDDASDEGSDSPKRTGDSDDAGGSEKGRVYVEPAPSDVLLGRGGRTNKHQGNRMYLQAKCSIQGRYMQAPKEEKTQISQNLVNMVRDWGGRFLKLDEVKNLWYEVPNSVARKKASQTLREITPPPSERSSKRAKISISAAKQQSIESSCHT